MQTEGFQNSVLRREFGSKFMKTDYGEDCIMMNLIVSGKSTKRKYFP
jgi:hypothetical protein